VALAYPYGDFGQADYTNTPEAAAINRELVRKHFDMTFVQEQYGINSSSSNPLDLKRFEIRKDMSAEQLLGKLALSEPWVQAKLAEADIAVRADQLGRAEAIYGELRAAGVDQPALWAGQGSAARAAGDAYDANRLLVQAQSVYSAQRANLEPATYDRMLNRTRIEARPDAGTDAQGFSDSQDNSRALLAARAGGWAGPVRLQGWAGQGEYRGPAFAGGPTIGIRQREGGVKARWFAGRGVELGASYGRRYFLGEDPKAFELYSAEAAFRPHPRLRLLLRDGMGNVETAAAVRDGRRFHNDGAGLAWDPAVNWKATADYDVARYNDSNSENIGRLRLQRRFFDRYTLGAAYLRGDSRRWNPDYYTPRSLNQYTALLGYGQPFGGLSRRTDAPRGFASAEYESGYGFQSGSSRFVQSIRGRLGYRVLDALSLNVEGQYATSPAYISRQLAAGLTLNY
ncbi:MAG: hypothetical protein PHF00_05290, partial [Elusimicrobia bacterium]|nr:hypothetical protein [Elusimicrobiota bacterium]